MGDDTTPAMAMDGDIKESGNGEDAGEGGDGVACIMEVGKVLVDTEGGIKEGFRAREGRAVELGAPIRGDDWKGSDRRSQKGRIGRGGRPSW